MQINATPGAYAASQASTAGRATQESSEAMRGPDNDADRDDQVNVQSLRRTPSVNAMGETIGQLIDVSA